ncbi:MAG: type IX secretion system protein PorQ [Bacteroidota bacterium]
MNKLKNINFLHRYSTGLILFTPSLDRALLFCFLLFTLSQEPGIAQIGGNNTYGFLNLVTSARVSALGGNAISIKDGDLNLAWHNPSLLDSNMHNHLALNFVDYFSDINYGSVIYSKTYEKYGSFSAGAHYIHYGTFIEADETGRIIKEFTADDYALIIGWGKNVVPKNYSGNSVFSIGANLKMIFSMLEQYTSFGAALDLSGTYHNAGRGLTVTTVVKNAGIQLKGYNKKNREPLPFEIQLGISKKLKHAPFRLLVVAQHLEKWDMTYKYPNSSVPDIDPITNEEIKEEKRTGDKLMRHFIIGGEFLITKNFHLRAGYNYQRRKELQVSTRTALTGFSGGFSFKVYKFNIGYARASYHLVGGPNYFTITTNLSEFYTK